MIILRGKRKEKKNKGKKNKDRKKVKRKEKKEKEKNHWGARPDYYMHACVYVCVLRADTTYVN